MPGLSREIVKHRLLIKQGLKPCKQPPRRFVPEINLKIKEEIKQLLKASFIETTWYVEWLSNIVPVKKKKGKLTLNRRHRRMNIICLLTICWLIQWLAMK